MGGSIRTPHGAKRHRSISVRIDGDETTYCGRRIAREQIKRDWHDPDCRSCLRRIARGMKGAPGGL